ncbi:hypothetical protein HOC01_01510 [archaeon]|jgi:Ala-tRNA(Pro) deacylase|nr:hypothetical protein [archaeon]MBT6698004.1 hypothetical protein [archaeon]
MEIFNQITELLKEHNIHYKHIEHQATPTSEESAKARGESIKIGAKALLLKSKHGFLIAIIPADKKLDTKLTKKVLKSKSLRFANEEELKQLTSLQKGAVPPFGHFFNLPTVIDPLLFQEEFMAFNAGSLTNSIKMKTKDYLIITNKLPNYSQEIITKE